MGNKEVQQAACQKLLEAIVHLRRAHDALLSIHPVVESEDRVQKIHADRAAIERMANYYDPLYLISAREAFRG